MNNSILKNYYKNTQNMCSLIAITLFILICTMVYPQNSNYIMIFGKLIALMLLGYIASTMFRETSFFIKNNSKIVNNTNLSIFRTNIILNYLISVTLFLLGLYVIYSFFF